MNGHKGTWNQDIQGLHNFPMLPPKITNNEGHKTSTMSIVIPFCVFFWGGGSKINISFPLYKLLFAPGFCLEALTNFCCLHQSGINIHCIVLTFEFWYHTFGSFTSMSVEIHIQVILVLITKLLLWRWACTPEIKRLPTGLMTEFIIEQLAIPQICFQ